MNKNCHINVLGVTGVGKSTYSRQITFDVNYAHGSPVAAILSNDLLKDGIRFVLEGNQDHPLVISNKQLLKPLKKIELEQVIDVAIFREKLNQIVRFELDQIEDNNLIVNEGFFIPKENLQNYLITRNVTWIEEILEKREIERHGRILKPQRNFAEKIFNIQKIYYDYLFKNNKINFVGYNKTKFSQISEKLLIKKNLAYYINPNQFIQVIFNKLDIAYTQNNISLFKKGLEYSFSRL
ncbi:MAG: hypothetical protein ACOCXG_01305 [Nanoarchaeota archaeon]